MKDIVIVGAGKIGSMIAEFLVFDGGFWCLIMVCLFVCFFFFNLFGFFCDFSNVSKSLG